MDFGESKKKYIQIPQMKWKKQRSRSQCRFVVPYAIYIVRMAYSGDDFDVRALESHFNICSIALRVFNVLFYGFCAPYALCTGATAGQMESHSNEILVVS